MSITISDEAVTAAAKALHHAEWPDETAAEQCWTQDPHGHADYGVQARIALAAALPHLRQQIETELLDKPCVCLGGTDHLRRDHFPEVPRG